jgi:hypothetical protein
MRLTDIAVERTTAATDLLLACVAGALAIYVCRLGRARDPWKAGLWASAFALLGLASALGAIAHGLQMSQRMRDALWQPLNLALGLTVALFAVAVVRDAWSAATARRVLPVAIALGVVFFGLTRLVPGTFLVFVLYEALALVFALVTYALLAVRTGLPGAGWMAAGIAISLIAAAIQASGTLSIRAIWRLDHNGVFHVVQIVGCLALLMGLRVGFLASPPAS